MCANAPFQDYTPGIYLNIYIYIIKLLLFIIIKLKFLNWFLQKKCLKNDYIQNSNEGAFKIKYAIIVNKQA